MKTVSVVGAAGYVGGEVLRLLLFHPEVTIQSATSQSQQGKKLYEVHPDLLGLTELSFSAAYDSQVDIIFLCMGHGKSKSYIERVDISDETVVIDLSRDYRLKADAEDFVYGLCELNKTAIRNTRRIANPGCFASCIQLGLLPLAQAGLLQSDVHVTAITGSTGAGQRPTPTSHFSWRNNNISVYKAFTHQHLDEIYQSIHQLQPKHEGKVHFIPMRGDFTRGIFASIYTKCQIEANEAIELYESYYADSPFVHVSAASITLKSVVNTNHTFIHVSKNDDMLRIESALDNLLKGAAGQAVQNMNLIMGWAENTGLQLKPSAF